MDHVQLEMPWTSQEEKFLNSKIDYCRATSKAHEIKAAKKKRNYYTLALPMIVVPFVAAAVTSHISPEDASILTTTSLTVTGVLNSVSQLFNFGKVSRLHEEFSGRYGELAGYIENELMKPKNHRIQLDVFLERVNQRMTSLNEQAPSLI